MERIRVDVSEGPVILTLRAIDKYMLKERSTERTHDRSKFRAMALVDVNDAIAFLSKLEIISEKTEMTPEDLIEKVHEQLKNFECMKYTFIEYESQTHNMASDPEDKTIALKSGLHRPHQILV